jgi:hypothetical protein
MRARAAQYDPTEFEVAAVEAEEQTAVGGVLLGVAKGGFTWAVSTGADMDG